MKTRKHIACIFTVVILCLALSCGICEGVVSFADPLAGRISYPDEANASLTYTYSFPQLSGETETASMINAFYRYLLDDAMAFTIPVTAEMLSGEGNNVPANITVSADVTCSNEKFISVCMRTDTATGAGSSVVYAGHTFPLSGEKQGECINLPFLLGKLKADNTDSWLEDRQTEKVNDCVRKLVWEIIEDQWASGQKSFFEGTSRESLNDVFFPDEDFYLDENGNPVFFIQEGYLAPVSEGALLYPFTVEELMDEM